MLNPTSLLADALGRNLAETYRRIFGEREPQIATALDEAARLVIERIASSDALYHDTQHTALVTLCVAGHSTRAAPRAGRIPPRVGTYDPRGADP